MSYDAERDAKAPAEINPNVRPDDRERTSFVWPFGVMVLLVIGCLILLGAERSADSAGAERDLGVRQPALRQSSALSAPTKLAGY